MVMNTSRDNSFEERGFSPIKQKLNLKARPFEPSIPVVDDELIVTTFERSDTQDSSPKDNDEDENLQTINDLMKQMNSDKAEIESLKEQLAVFTSFKMPFKLPQNNLKEVNKFKFNTALIPGCRKAIIKAFNEEKTLATVSNSLKNYLVSNSDTKNWLCYIRPTQFQKCLNYSCISDITFCFTRNNYEYRVTLAQLL